MGVGRGTDASEQAPRAGSGDWSGHGYAYLQVRRTAGAGSRSWVADCALEAGPRAESDGRRQRSASFPLKAVCQITADGFYILNW